MDYSSLVILSPLNPVDLTPEQVKMLIKGRTRDYTDRTVKEYIDEVLSGLSVLWQWNTKEGSGIVKTLILGRGRETELFLDIVVGKGYLKLLPTIMEDLKTIARNCGCSKIGAMSCRPGFYSRHQNIGWKDIGTYAVYEVDSGREEDTNS